MKTATVLVFVLAGCFEVERQQFTQPLKSWSPDVSVSFDGWAPSQDVAPPDTLWPDVPPDAECWPGDRSCLGQTARHCGNDFFWHANALCGSAGCVDGYCL